MTRVLFIHRSVGRHMLHYGRLRRLLNDTGILIDDYDNNTGVLSFNDSSTTKGQIIMPGDNTNPSNLLEFFNTWPAILDNYDTIMIKSCYPNSHIRNPEQLEEIKSIYSGIVNAFTSHNKNLFLLTTPPLRPIKTNHNEAELASELAYWLVDQLGPHCFDLHHFYSVTQGKYVGMLKTEYRKLLPWDTHPNAKAHKQSAPLIASSIAKSNASLNG